MSSGRSRARKAGWLGLVIVATVWAFTLWQWHHMPHEGKAPHAVSGADVVRQFLLLPLIVTAVAWLAWAVVRRLRAGLIPPLAASPADVASAPAGHPSPEAGVVPAARPVATVLAEACSLPAGGDAVSAWRALQEGRVRPTLDPQLEDADGFPAFSARVPDGQLAESLQALADQVAAQALAQGGTAGSAWPDEVLRTLALLQGPLQALLAALAAVSPGGPTEPAAPGWRVAHDPGEEGDEEGGDEGRTEDRKEDRMGGAGTAGGGWAATARGGLPADAPAHLSGVARPDRRARQQAEAERVPHLQVRLCLPVHWPPRVRADAADWLRSQCGALLDWTERHGAPPPTWHTEPLPSRPDAAAPESLWTEWPERWQGWSTSPRPQLLLLLAADSAVDAAQVLRWQAHGELFTSHHQRGRIPGEAAAGLLLCNPAWASCAPGDAMGGACEPPGPRMWHPLAAQRTRSADVVGRVGSEALQGLLRRLADGPQADAGCLIVSDGDHRPSRTAEVFEALLEVRPQADPLSEVLRVGDACGELGLARALVPVALASSALRHGQAKGLVLALMVQDGLQRVAIALESPSALSQPVSTLAPDTALP